MNDEGHELMSQFIAHTLNWLTLVIPALVLAGGAAYFVRGWLQGSFLKFCGAFIAGASLVGAVGFIWTRLSWFLINRKIVACEQGPDPFFCYGLDTGIAYPVLSGIIAFLVFVAGVLIWGLTRIFRALALRFGKRDLHA